MLAGQCSKRGHRRNMTQRNIAILNSSNALKLGLFGANCSSGRSYTTLPERWDASWDNNVKLAQLAESVGLDCLVPIARWKGYGGRTNVNGSTFESITWACGLLAETRRIDVFCTIHVPLNHPIVAAKQLATADHVGKGRLGLNLVCGWNEDEFQMFGVSKREHDDRYEEGEEWWTVVKKIWAGLDAFDHAGKYFSFRGVEGLPTPYGGQRPVMMNAGASPTSRAFAIHNADLHFDGVRAPEDSIERIAETKRLAAGLGRDMQVWTPVGIVCRPTQREAEDYVQHCLEHADWGAVDHLAELHASDARNRTDAEGVRRRRGDDPTDRKILARGVYCVFGDPDFVAQELLRLHSVGFDGLALNFVNYLDELPYFAQEVLPRLERAGARKARTPSPCGRGMG
jgi:FMNH2-dependent dimethyl sulfone monooxygenase